MNKIFAAGAGTVATLTAVAVCTLAGTAHAASAQTHPATRSAASARSPLGVRTAIAPAGSSSSSLVQSSSTVRSTPSYGQKGGTVTVYEAGKRVGTLTLTSATYSGKTGRIVLAVTADTEFSFTRAQFIWEDPSGGDTLPAHPQQVVNVQGSSPQQVVLDYQKVGKGDLIWAPDDDSTVGIWLIPASGKTSGTTRASEGYTQKGGTVTVYRGPAKIAAITRTSATYHSGNGTVVLSATAEKSFRFAAGEFIWEDPSGADTLPVNPKKVEHVTGSTPQQIVIRYRKVANGDLIWAPDGDLTAAVWGVSPSQG